MKASWIIALVAALVVALPAADVAARPRCAGKLSGDVTATFGCTAFLGTGPGGERVFVIHLSGPVAGVPAVAPGAFEVPGPLAARTFTLDELGPGKASVAVERGALYTAAKTTSQRGEVTLRLSSVRKSATIAGAFEVHGSYRARLLPVGSGRVGEVVVDVRF